MELSGTIEFDDGKLIIIEGQKTDRNVYVILAGQVRVVKETEKGQVHLALLEEGDIFGEVSFLAQERGTRSASVIARGKVKVGILDPEKLTVQYRSLSPTFQKILRDLSERFSRTTTLASRVAAKRMKVPTLERRQARRSSPLRELRIRVDYIREDDYAVRTTPSGKEAYQTVLVDLSTTGMGMELLTSTFSKSSHIPGDKFMFQFTLPGRPMIRVPGQLAWVREMPGKRARMGVQFSEANPYLEKLIKEFLREVMKE
ncbi:MAG: cyclic nucleotide-binding domain-containing protein [Deltaproteobacteria bacterium]|nr:MAG: cyclic nucleotide-binding domain-containing protein [Deltaproteobacteria bacterium]